MSIQSVPTRKAVYAMDMRGSSLPVTTAQFCADEEPDVVCIFLKISAENMCLTHCLGTDQLYIALFPSLPIHPPPKPRPVCFDETKVRPRREPGKTGRFSLWATNKDFSLAVTVKAPSPPTRSYRADEKFPKDTAWKPDLTKCKQVENQQGKKS